MRAKTDTEPEFTRKEREPRLRVRRGVEQKRKGGPSGKSLEGKLEWAGNFDSS